MNSSIRLLSFIFISVCTTICSVQTQVEGTATPVDKLSVSKGFQVELLYTVPKAEQGSWVNLCIDGKGRIIASDQFGGLYRFPAPSAGQPLQAKNIKKVPAKIRAANGLLWAFDALYVGVNDYQKQMESGLYRVTDSDGDDQLDKVEKLRGMSARGDHGIHAVLLAPDGKSLYLITGNNTIPTEIDASRVPLHWGEDHLLPRMPDGRGHNRGRLAPGGIIYKVSPDGKHWENISSGYRNIFDGGFNKAGDLFTYDADMEYDFNTSWYRPTRVNHVTSGSMWGWRNGTGKRPEFYSDTLPPVINIGPGSPTGVTFGYGAKFPAKYQKAMFLLDWSWGKIHAVHMKPKGSSYVATKETFITGSPLPVADAIINPQDGAMYFAIGGRKVQSGLYRVTYKGKESTAPAKHQTKVNELSQLRRNLEKFHKGPDSKAIKAAWPYLDHADRFVRWAALTAVQHQPVKKWANRALKEKDHGKRVYLLLGLAKVTGIDPFHRQPSDPPTDSAMGNKILQSLGQVDWDQLNEEQGLALVRAYQVSLVRFGKADAQTTARIIQQLDPHFPAPTFEQNWLLCETLAFLQAPTTAAKAMELLQAAPTQEEQIEYARSLRMLKSGWNKKLRTAYFNWFLKAANYRGGASFTKFIEFIRNDAVASLSKAEQEEFKTLLAKKPESKTPFEIMAESMIGRKYVKQWTLEELSQATENLKGRNFAQGRKMFAAGGCFACHRFGNEGGMTGPDLTGSGGRYSSRDLLEQIIDPSKEINEQFVPTIVKMKNGDVMTGVVVNLNGERVTLNTDMFDPNQRINVNRPDVVSIGPSDISPMPPGLLNMMQKEEVMDLVAYILSGGDRTHKVFRQ